MASGKKIEHEKKIGKEKEEVEKKAKRELKKIEMVFPLSSFDSVEDILVLRDGQKLLAGPDPIL